MPVFTRPAGPKPEMSLPSIVTVPLDRVNAVRASINDVLPAPLGPIRPVTWPGSSVNPT